MPRRPQEYKALHDAADQIEPQVARAFERAVLKMRESISINELAMRLAARDFKGAARVLTDEQISDTLNPCATIVRNAMYRGGRLGANEVNKKTGG